MKTRLNLFAETNMMLIENHPEWGLSVNGKILPSEITSIANSIKGTPKQHILDDEPNTGLVF